MQIKQIRVSDTLSFFKDKIIKKHNFVEYKDIYSPTFFFGIYTQTDLVLLRKHRGIKIIIWSGSDIDYQNNDNVVRFIKYIKKMKKIHHISNSKFISNDLKHFNIKFIELPICGVNTHLFSPVVKGKKIYIYTSALKPTKYGSKLYNQVIDKLPQFQFILATNMKSIKKANKLGINYDKRIRSYNSKKIIDIYGQCFIGLRLTKHDGISYSVIEMGLCGIKCVHNGNQPNAISYETVNDIVETIINESKKIGKQHFTINKRVRQYLKLKKDWNKTNFYFPKMKYKK